MPLSLGGGQFVDFIAAASVSAVLDIVLGEARTSAEGPVVLSCAVVDWRMENFSGVDAGE